MSLTLIRSLVFAVLFYLSTAIFVVGGSILLLGPRRWAMAGLKAHAIVSLWLLRWVVGTRMEVLSVLHLLDKPDVVWEDAGAERIYEAMRVEFDLVDRYEALELKLRSVQDALTLVTDVARDRRLVLLEVSIVVLILFEIVLSLVRG